MGASPADDALLDSFANSAFAAVIECPASRVTVCLCLSAAFFSMISPASGTKRDPETLDSPLIGGAGGAAGGGAGGAGGPARGGVSADGRGRPPPRRFGSGGGARSPGLGRSSEGAKPLTADRGWRAAF